MLISIYDRVENMVGKGENDTYYHFLLFLVCFQNTLLKGIKSCDCAVKGYGKCLLFRDKLGLKRQFGLSFNPFQNKPLFLHE